MKNIWGERRNPRYCRFVESSYKLPKFPISKVDILHYGTEPGSSSFFYGLSGLGCKKLSGAKNFCRWLLFSDLFVRKQGFKRGSKRKTLLKYVISH